MSIILGYDESPGARRALTTAIDLADRVDEVLVLVYGVAPPGGVGDEHRTYQEALTEMGRTATEHAVAQAESAGVPTVVEIIADKPAQAIIAAADKHDAQVIVVGTYGESPLRGAMLGSTPHKLLHLSSRPVLCVPAHHPEI
ncbi:MAG: universal stress protein [Geodermatophilaceae bacterium]|nr:universal stress protein [Geodermatophilaceae bacterium]